jgi:adenosylcobinamide kinase / adenosylcobinamide-phosphate guanylyltransferase
MIYLVTGPARSGKSEWAETLAAGLAEADKRIIYLATAQRDASDLEWQQRIEQHRDRRPTVWQTQEVPVQLATTIARLTHQDCALIDSLGTWVANCLDQEEIAWAQTQMQLLQTIEQAAADLIFVAEETGWGVVPAYPLGRKFRDRLGHLTRQVALRSQAAYLVTAGFAIDLHQIGTPVVSQPRKLM